MKDAWINFFKSVWTSYRRCSQVIQTINYATFCCVVCNYYTWSCDIGCLDMHIYEYTILLYSWNYINWDFLYVPYSSTPFKINQVQGPNLSKLRLNFYFCLNNFHYVTNLSSNAPNYSLSINQSYMCFEAKLTGHSAGKGKHSTTWAGVIKFLFNAGWPNLQLICPHVNKYRPSL